MMDDLKREEFNYLNDYQYDRVTKHIAKLRANDMARNVALTEFMMHSLNAVDNLNDMPVSDDWADRWATKAMEMLVKNDYFRSVEIDQLIANRERVADLEERLSHMQSYIREQSDRHTMSVKLIEHQLHSAYEQLIAVGYLYPPNIHVTVAKSRDSSPGSMEIDLGLDTKTPFGLFTKKDSDEQH